ncbi:RNA polymerase-associated protein RapA [Sinobacterium norvegicum]|uniref:RNA polymerase-associated protein RapA n=1 Tax=Sinobacterium norvegicum TaxID=1641715 RepID=A0ABM9AFJ9_9GAMM|nr:RNA polymerase-associated protein RapA [Sinobacterium norvegicum]CAH0991982.1 RNA polymerase-associated protein RapA [Sinobacterium norvegicum]
MMEFVIGQRWISHSEAKLGLGLIKEIENRQLIVSFPAAGEERIYAANSAPLSRICYKINDTICNLDEEQFTVLEVEENRGLISYQAVDDLGEVHTIDELELSCFIAFTSPQQRLFSGQFDRLGAFKLRAETLQHNAKLQQSPVQGLLGSRTNSLPHQLYIASEVASRYAPRVLLADEVGLGKTIEAGMIIHHQLHTGLSSRVLITVPDTLVHQWLVEMLRRFNLRFSIFNGERYNALLEAGEDNPFETEQLILCSLDFLIDNDRAQQHAIDAGWDMLVVDEAHHLHWHDGQAGEDYATVEQLAEVSHGLLLLTATPEQVGIESHFARLRLLDPAKFHDLAEFEQQEAGYLQLNQLVQPLLDQPETIHQAEQQATIADYFGDGELTQLLTSHQALDDKALVDLLIAKLLDRHGTGRVQFRNTRSAIKGFPERQLNSYPLPCPDLYIAEQSQWGESGLYPETQHDADEWIEFDPRVQWLIDFYKQNKQEKVLVICAHAQTALDLEHHLQLRAGIRSAAFFEGLSIIERDRAAAYFAEAESGAQTLVCSEIGSEGRNFQFARHLVLFDLPLNPDLLEQRIGRLDRIGQQHTIQIHTPYLQDSAQEVLFNWYHDGLNLFQQSFSAGFALFEQFETELQAQLNSPCENFSQLLSETRAATEQTKQKLQQGRDRLLEINSCNHQKAAAIIDEIFEFDDSFSLQNYMQDVFDQYGVEYDYHSPEVQVIHAGEHMYTAQFPGLNEDGNTITFDRDVALSREEFDFLTWEHPMVVEVMDMIISSEFGNATIATMSVNGLPPATILLETIFTVNTVAPKSLQLERFLPQTPIRVLVDVSGKELSQVITLDGLNKLCKKIPKTTAHAVIKQVQPSVEGMIKISSQNARAQLPELLSKGKQQLRAQLTSEIDRLVALQQLNSGIRNGEIDFLRHQLDVGCELIDMATIEMQAMRVVINT